MGCKQEEEVFNLPDNIGFIYLGETAENTTLPIPAPTSAPFESEWAFDGARNANNVLRGQFVGRQIDKQNMTWGLIKKEDWWALNQFRLENKNIFWCKYFDHNIGVWRTRRFYSGNPKVDLRRIDKETGEPFTYYYNASLNIVDTGEGD